jgi:uncharacterized membrane protein (UPF0127 family)
MAIKTEPGMGEPKNNHDTIVVDIGSRSRKQIKQLRKGKGKLMDKVNECLGELKASGSISTAVQPVVIVVKEKATLGKFMGLMGRPTLDPGAGLWLTGNGIHMMFMRFPIDAVFLGKPDPANGGTRAVVSVHPRLKAWTGLVPLVRGADGVLELPAGTIERSRTEVGDRVAMEPIQAG